MPKYKQIKNNSLYVYIIIIYSKNGKKKKLIIPQKELIVCDPLVIYVIPHRSNYFLVDSKMCSLVIDSCNKKFLIWASQVHATWVGKSHISLHNYCFYPFCLSKVSWSASLFKITYSCPPRVVEPACSFGMTHILVTWAISL